MLYETPIADLQSKTTKCFLPKRIRFQIFFMKLDDCVKLHLEK
jgi:hypothetical protein